MSAAEAINTAYGFESRNDVPDDARSMQTSDYSIAHGAYTSGPCGAWWFRSSSNNASNYVQAVNASGNANFHSENVDKTEMGVVPAMNIDLSKVVTDEDVPDTETDSDVSTEISGTEDVTETATEAPYAGPDENGIYNFIPQIDGRNTIWTSTNQSVANSVARMSLHADVDGTVSFSILVSSENGCDFLNVYKNSEKIISVSGTNQTEYAYHEIQVSAGDEIVVEYVKDLSANGGDDTAYVKNIGYSVTETEVVTAAPEEESGGIDENGYYRFSSYTDGDVTVWQSSNQYIGGSTAKMTFAVDFKGSISLYMSVSSESGCDVLRIRKNGEEVINRSGSYDNEYLEIDVNEGDEITITYSKDGSVDGGTDTATIRNIVFTRQTAYLPTEAPTEEPTEESTVDPEEGTLTESDSESEEEIESEENIETEDGASESESETEETYTYDENGIFAFVEDEKGNFKSTNKNNDGSVSRKTITCEADGLYQIHTKISSEAMCDKLIILVGDKVAYVASGESEKLVDVYVSVGDVITIEYVKDASGNGGNDEAVINLTFTEGAEPESETDKKTDTGSSTVPASKPEETESSSTNGMAGGAAMVSGCLGTIGTGAIAVILSVITSLAAFRKKED